LNNFNNLKIEMNSHVPKSDSIDPQPEVTDFQPDGSLAANSLTQSEAEPLGYRVFWATWQHETDLYTSYCSEL
jgi:hypothetical protein